MPYDETNLKYFYKIFPIKNDNDIYLEWFLPLNDNYFASPLGYLSSVIIFAVNFPSSIMVKTYACLMDAMRTSLLLE